MEEGTLIRRAAAGDGHAFGILVRSHQAAVFRWIRRLVRDDETASDLTQEAFLRAWRGLASFRGEAAFGTWLRTIATNVARTHGRRGREAAFVALDPEQAAPGEAPDAALERESERRALLSALEQLPPRQREVVTLRVHHELPYSEIARRTGSSENACKVNFHHAVKRLRRLLTTAPADPSAQAGAGSAAAAAETGAPALE
ncbi:MAG: RNA polymerase sigma factor [Gemmatimonadota bacterium]